MAETFPRSRLQVDRLYYCIPTQQWFSTPDGIGVYCYDSREHGLDETGFGEESVSFITVPLADW